MYALSRALIENPIDKACVERCQLVEAFHRVGISQDKAAGIAAQFLALGRIVQERTYGKNKCVDIAGRDK
jgi:hypothetical protein